MPCVDPTTPLTPHTPSPSHVSREHPAPPTQPPPRLVSQCPTLGQCACCCIALPLGASIMLPSSSHFSSSSSTAASATARPARLSPAAIERRLLSVLAAACSLHGRLLWSNQQIQQQHQHWRPAAGGVSCSSPSSRTSSSCDPDSRSSEEPWALMGRVVQSERLELGNTSRQRLTLLAAARQAGVTPDAMAAALQELATLLPDLASLLPSLSPALLAPLASDTAAVAHKLIHLRLLFPAADVGRMISRRPMLLLDDQFEQVEPARAKLLARMALTQPAAADVQQASGASVGPPPQQQQPSVQRACATQSSCPALDALVSQQPLLLVAHVDELLDELERLMPGVLVLPLLQRNPSLLLSVQRGSSDLGPGAEFMGPG